MSDTYRDIDPYDTWGKRAPATRPTTRDQKRIAREEAEAAAALAPPPPPTPPPQPPSLPVAETPTPMPAAADLPKP